MKKRFNISLYWKCQVAGWSIASLYWGYAAFSHATVHFNLQQAIVDFILDVVVGIGLTHAYRYVALTAKWPQLKLASLVLRITPAIVVLSFLYMVLIIGKLYGTRYLFNPHWAGSFEQFFIDNRLGIFITGTRLLSIWVLAYHLYHYAHREINTAKENARLSVLAKEAQLSNLSAQLNPHFFFNSLGNIKFLVTENPEAARRAIDLLSDLLRHSLYRNNDTLIPIAEEMDLVKDYLELEKLRFEERLQVRIVADETLAGIYVPPFSIQTLVENAVKHGIEKRKEGGLIEVKALKQDERIRISVQNPGKLNAQQQTGLGLKNLHNRLHLQYNGKAGLHMEELAGEQILTTISISMV